MKLYNFNSIFSLALTLYDVNLNPQEFEDIALTAWEQIGTKHTRLYTYIADTVDKEIELPCNLDVIESVHLPIEDAQMTSNKTVFYSTETLWIEGYIEAWKRTNDPYYSRGKLVKYKEADNALVFSRDYKKVKIVYHGIQYGEEGLPLVNDKETHAIAAYLAYIDLFRTSKRMRDKNLMELAMIAKADWKRYCNAARVPQHFSQNDMDAILDAKVRWDRKQFGKSIKPIL